MGKITKIIFLDNIKSRVVIVYFVLLALLSWTSLLLQDNESKGALTVLNIILFVTPLMSLLYTVTYLYDSHDFQVLLLSQPIKRKQIWQSLYMGVSSSLLIAFLLGAGIPMLMYTDLTTGLILVLMGCVNTLIFVSLAFLTTMLTSDKTRGTGVSILIWLLLTHITYAYSSRLDPLPSNTTNGCRSNDGLWRGCVQRVPRCNWWYHRVSHPFTTLDNSSIFYFFTHL